METIVKRMVGGGGEDGRQRICSRGSLYKWLNIVVEKIDGLVVEKINGERSIAGYYREILRWHFLDRSGIFRTPKTHTVALYNRFTADRSENSNMPATPTSMTSMILHSVSIRDIVCCRAMRLKCTNKPQSDTGVPPISEYDLVLGYDVRRANCTIADVLDDLGSWISWGPLLPLLAQDWRERVAWANEHGTALTKSQEKEYMAMLFASSWQSASVLEFGFVTLRLEYLHPDGDADLPPVPWLVLWTSSDIMMQAAWWQNKHLKALRKVLDNKMGGPQRGVLLSVSLSSVHTGSALTGICTQNIRPLDDVIVSASATSVDRLVRT